MIGRNDNCWCGSHKKWKKCHFPQPPLSLSSAELTNQYAKLYGIILKTEEQIAHIRKACQLASTILQTTRTKAVAGVTTQELNDYAHQLHLQAGAIPAPLHYGSPPFPKSICTSLNEVICHGIPNDRPLQEGDILNIDVTSILNGYYGDCSCMVTIGKIDAEKQKVVDTSYECLMQAIAILKPGIPLFEIGEVIEKHARQAGCSVVYQFVAHGVGVNFHEAPQIAHHRNQDKILLVPGMTFTLEPMINAGVREAVINKNNLWEASTKDGKPSAQWEHTVLITETGHEILTTWTR